LGGKIGKTGAKKLIYTSFFFTTKLKKNIAILAPTYNFLEVNIFSTYFTSHMKKILAQYST